MKIRRKRAGDEQNEWDVSYLAGPPPPRAIAVVTLPKPDQTKRSQRLRTLGGVLGILTTAVTVLSVMIIGGRSAMGEMTPNPSESRQLPMVEQVPELNETGLEEAVTNPNARTKTATRTKARVPRPADTGPTTTPQMPNLPDQPSRTAISRAIITIRSRVHQCGDRHPGSGIVRVKLRISAKGKLLRADALTEHNALGHCVAEAMTHASFPASREGVAFTYSFAFGR